MTALAGVDTIKARETPSASVGVTDTISCGSPRPPLPSQTFMGVSIGGDSSARDSLDYDLPTCRPPTARS